MDVIAILLSYLVFWLALPILVLHPKLRDGVRNRLGLFDANWPQIQSGPRVWLHGASAGDVLALMPTVRELRRRVPNARVIITTVTNSGRAMAERERQEFAAIGYLPYDLPGSVRRTLDRYRPDVLVLEYTELWPRLINTAASRGVKLALHNGRFSTGRLNSYRRLFFFVGNLLSRFSLLLMRDEYEADAARRLGATDDQIQISGNTKFDNLTRTAPANVVAELQRATGFSPDDLVWVVGSTHEGEEDSLLQIFTELRPSFPRLKMIIAPRYVERAERVRGLASRSDLTVRFRSVPGDPVDVLILDTIGELAACYQLATIVFVGGSFVHRGGQNILEPAICAKPVLFGPYMDNFADSVQVLLGRGGIQVASPDQLAKVMTDLLGNPAHCQEIGRLAAEQVSRVRGAAGRNAEAIAALLQRQATR